MNPTQKPIETIIKIEMPFKRVAAPTKRDKFYSMLPWSVRWFGWLYCWGGGSVGDCQGRTNTTRHLQIFRRHVLTIHRNEYHDKSDSERAAEYLEKWSECERELRGFRLMALGDETGLEVKRFIKESLGVDLDEGRILYPTKEQNEHKPTLPRKTRRPWLDCPHGNLYALPDVLRQDSDH